MAIAIVVGVRDTHEPTDADLRATLASDEELREEVIQRLVGSSPGIFDSHADSSVGRVLSPSLHERVVGGIAVTSDSFGMRERQYAMPKPDGVIRVVLLGDSFIFGDGCLAEERLGAFLEAWLTERSEREIEVLHIGIGSWNILAECAFVRRQLAELQPDAVIQFSVQNDLDDCSGVRGFGALSRFSPHSRERADGMLGELYPFQIGFPTHNYLSAGLDWESRQRFEESGREMERLAELVTRQGGRYLHVINWGVTSGIATAHWAPHLRPELLAYVPSSLTADPRFRLSETDSHWSPAGHERVALLVYALIVDRELLPELELPEWDRASRELEALHVAGELEAQRGGTVERLLTGASSPIASSIDFDALTTAGAAQIYGGIGADQLLAPYASIILKSGAGERLWVEGTCLDRPELDGAEVRVFVDEEEVGVITLRQGATVSEDWPVPPAARDREFVSVRFVASDFVYSGYNLQRCVAFRLERVAIAN